MRRNSIQHLINMVHNTVGKPTIEGMRKAAVKNHWTWEGPLNHQCLGQTYEAHDLRVYAALAKMNNQTLGGIIGFGLDRSGEPSDWVNDDVFIQVTSYTELADQDDRRLSGRALLITMAARVLICAAYDLALQTQYREYEDARRKAYAIW